MLPDEMNFLVAVLGRIEQLERRKSWGDAKWREELAAAAAEIQQVGHKLAQVGEQRANAGLKTAGEEAQRTGSHYLEALELYGSDKISDKLRLPGVGARALISARWVTLLAQGAILQQALQEEVAQQRLMEQARLN